MWIRDVLKAASEAAGTLFYPPHCVGCRAMVPWGAYVCGACMAEAPRLEPPFCAVCSQPFLGEMRAEFRCANCGDRRFHFDFAATAFRNRGLVREMVHGLKYQGHYYLRHPLSELLAAALDDKRLAGWSFDVICPVPLHATRRRERGFNQAEVLAVGLASRCGRPVEELLRRVRATQTQTRFDRADRMENLRNAFQLRKNAEIKGARILLVDDVLTTGSTIEECARVLKRAGARTIRAAVVARS